jgi:hypothetical protein
MAIKVWVDDVRPAPDGYTEFKTVNDTLRFIYHNYKEIEEISLDYHCGWAMYDWENYINILIEMERLSRFKKFDFSHIKFRLHSSDPVGVQNMREILEDNGWKEIG